MINEFIAKKLGEVGAFAALGKDTLDKGMKASSELWGESKTREILDMHEKTLSYVDDFAKRENVEGITIPKQEATFQKLQAMRDMYMKDAWDNPVEIAEWSGFFLGAAKVHWALVEGAAEALRYESLAANAKENITFHDALLTHTQNYLHSAAKTKIK